MFRLSANPRIIGWALAAAIAITGFQTAAFAGGGTAVAANGRSTLVNVADLNLATDGGRSQLDARIRRAANRVCAIDGSGDLASLGDQARCRAAAITAAQTERDVRVAAARTRAQQARAATPDAAVN